MKCCRFASEGLQTFEGFARVLKNPRSENSRALSWHYQSRARVSRVFARVYAWQRGTAARGQTHDQSTGKYFSYAYRTLKPSLPSRFSINRLKNKSKNPLTIFSKPSPNPLNPRKDNFDHETRIEARERLQRAPVGPHEADLCQPGFAPARRTDDGSHLAQWHASQPQRPARCSRRSLAIGERCGPRRVPGAMRCAPPRPRPKGANEPSSRSSQFRELGRKPNLLMLLHSGACGRNGSLFPYVTCACAGGRTCARSINLSSHSSQNIKTINLKLTYQGFLVGSFSCLSSRVPPKGELSSQTVYYSTSVPQQRMRSTRSTRIRVDLRSCNSLSCLRSGGFGWIGWIFPYAHMCACARTRGLCSKNPPNPPIFKKTINLALLSKGFSAGGSTVNSPMSLPVGWMQ
jgi:hypothetical protein